MSVFITRCLHPRPPFTHVRQGQTGPSRIRLKRNNQKEVKGGSNDNPYIFHPRVRTVEPVRQALRNTKSIMIMGLPAVVLSGMNDLPFEYIMPQIKNGLVSSFSCVDNSLNVKRAHQKKGDIMNVIKAVWSSADRYDNIIYSFHPLTHMHSLSVAAILPIHATTEPGYIPCKTHARYTPNVLSCDAKYTFSKYKKMISIRYKNIVSIWSPNFAYF